MKLEDIVQPTEVRTSTCPSCGEQVTMVPYDIGSGPEMSCSSCEWCWGADGQDLKPLETPMLGIMFRKCEQCGQDIGVRWPNGEAPKNCTEHQ